MLNRDVLKDIVIISHLTDEMVDQLLPLVELRTYEAGDIIFKDGDAADTFYLLKRGKVLLEQRLSEKVTVSVGAVKAGYSFGWSAMLSGRTYTLDTVCSEYCEVLAINATTFLELLDNNHSMGYRIMSRLLRVTKKRLDQRTTLFLRVMSRHPDIQKLIDVDKLEI